MEPQILDYVMDDGTKIQCLLSKSDQPLPFDECRHTVSFTLYVNDIMWLYSDTHWGILNDDPEMGEWLLVPIVACIKTHAEKMALQTLATDILGIDLPDNLSKPHIKELTPEQCDVFMDDHGADVFVYLFEQGMRHATELGIEDRIPH